MRVGIWSERFRVKSLRFGISGSTADMHTCSCQMLSFRPGLRDFVV